MLESILAVYEVRARVASLIEGHVQDSERSPGNPLRQRLLDRLLGLTKLTTTSTRPLLPLALYVSSVVPFAFIFIQALADPPSTEGSPAPMVSALAPPSSFPTQSMINRPSIALDINW